MKQPGARKTPFGYKAIVIHGDGRTEVLARRGGVHTPLRAGKVFPTREEAFAFAKLTIEARKAEHLKRMEAYHERHR